MGSLLALTFCNDQCTIRPILERLLQNRPRIGDPGRRGGQAMGQAAGEGRRGMDAGGGSTKPRGAISRAPARTKILNPITTALMRLGVRPDPRMALLTIRGRKSGR